MLIGADPEFVFRYRGELVHANYQLHFESAFGCDGHPATGELRPTPAPTPKGLVANIRALINRGYENKMVKRYELLSGHYKFSKSIGGHIHLSGFCMDMPTITQKLDLILGELSNCIDPLDERARRMIAGYGSGYRVQGTNWIEYRTPGSWLLSPSVTFMNIWLAYAVACEYIESKRKAFMAFNKLDGGTDGIIQFALKSIAPEKEIFVKCADAVFSSLPLDWDIDSKENWR